MSAAWLVGCGDGGSGSGGGSGSNDGGNGGVELDDFQLTTAEDMPVTRALDVPAGTSITVSGAPAHGAATITSGTLTFTPAENYNGADRLTLSLSSGGETSTTAVTITVTPVNDAPRGGADSRAVLEDNDLVVTKAQLLANDEDVDDDELTLDAVGGEVKGTVAIDGDNVKFRADANFEGTASFNYTVTDGMASAMVTVTVAVGGENDPPVANNDDRATLEDTPVAIGGASLVFNDTDAENQTLTVKAVGTAAHGTVVLDATRTRVTYTPALNFAGADSFEYTVTDGAADAVARVNMTIGAVNDAPVAGNDDRRTNEDTRIEIQSESLLENDTDVENEPLTVEAVGTAGHGTVVLDATRTKVTYTPALNFAGSDSFEYTVTDGAVDAVGRVNVTIDPINDAPVAGNDDRRTNEDTLIEIQSTSLVGNDTDAENQALTVKAVGTAGHGTVVFDATRTKVAYTPDLNFAGIDTFTYTVTDGAADGVGQVNITVDPINDAPVAVDDDRRTNEDTRIEIQSTSLVDNDIDPEDQTLTIEAVGTAGHGTVVLDATRTKVTYTPAPDFSGTDSFTYTATDGALDAVGRVNITVDPVNDAPVAVDDDRTTNEDTRIEIQSASLVGNDTDVDSQTLTVKLVGTAGHGTAVLDPTRTKVTYTPALNFAGTDSFEYTVTDGAADAVGRVNITIDPINDAPVAVNDERVTDEDTRLEIQSESLVDNDTDVDSQTLTVKAVGTASHGTVVLDATRTKVTYTPELNFAGADSFTYTVTDGEAEALGTVTIQFNSINDAPVAVDDDRTTNEDTSIEIPSTTLVSNDTDVDSQTLTVKAVGTAGHGTVVLDATRTRVTYTPAQNFFGTDSFEYTVTDGDADAVGRVNMTVRPINDAPVAGSDSAAVQTGLTLELETSELLANDVDVEGDQLSIIAIVGVFNGSAVLTGGGQRVTFTTGPGFQGTASFQYLVSDGALTGIGVVVITVTAAPVCGDGVLAGSEQCDDGNRTNDDGCNALCQREDGFDCDGSPTVCVAICGDGLEVGDEECDDNNDIDEDGCTTLCRAGVECTASALPGGDRFATDPETGSCYVSFDDQQTTFAAAQAACVGLGGYLTTITSAAENARVISVLNPLQNPWIGASEDGTDDDAVFDWVTDEPFEFSSFVTGQPDDDGECLHMANAIGQWSDTDCGASTLVIGRICELEVDSCGDSVVQDGEECDTTLAGCSATCQLTEGCGDGDVDAGEECDDDGVTSGDGCSASCTFELVAGISCIGAAGNEATIFADTTAAGLAELPALVRGTGIQPNSGSGSFNSSNWTLNAVLDPTDFIGFTVAPAPGVTVNMLQLQFGERRSGTGPQTWELRSSLDNFQTAVASGATTPSAQFTTQSVVLPAQFRNLTTAVELRVFGFAAGANTGTWRVGLVKLVGFTTLP